MKRRYILYRRKRGGMFYIEDTETRKQESTGTRNRAEATSLLNARNESIRQPHLNLQIAKAYSEQPGSAWKHPDGRKFVFVGDLVDRGPKIPDVVRLVLESVNAGTALCVPGNHDMKFMRKIWGKDVQITHGLAESLAQFEAYESAYRGFSRITASGMSAYLQPQAVE